jgi:hypothetical protein
MSQEKTQEKRARGINCCSFCGKPQDEDERLCGGSNFAIVPIPGWQQIDDANNVFLL